MKFLFCCIVSFLASRLCAVSIDLSRVRIVVPEGATTNALRAAEELEFHLKLVAGERMPSDDGVRFVVGKRPSEASPAKDFQSCAKFAGGSLYFWGDEQPHGINLSRGPLFAVYEFLDAVLGVTWAFPGTDGIVAARRRCIDLEDGASWQFTPPFSIAKFRTPDVSSYRKYIDKAEIPDVFKPSRKWWDGWRGDIAVWYDRMRIACTNDIPIDHSFKNWQKRYLKDHPEWFAYVTNPVIRRTDTNNRGVVEKEAKHVQFCVSNPEVPVAIVEEWRSRGAPRDFSIGPNDGKYCFCHCESCLKLDTRRPGEHFFDHLTDRYVQFNNRIAELAVKIRPDVRLSTYAYSAYEKPPRREKVECGENLYFSVVPVFGDDYGGGTGFGKLLDDWHALGMRHFYVRPNFMWYCPAIPRGVERFLYDNFRAACERGSIGFSYGCWPRPLNDLEYYVLASVLHDPGLGFDAIAERFYSQYGTAAKEAKAYFERVRGRSSRVMDAMVRAANRHLDDSGLAKHAFGCVTREDLAGDIPLLLPGLNKTLSPVERRRFEALHARAFHALLAFDFVSLSKGSDEVAFQKAAKELYDFRIANFELLGREGGAWYSPRNCERAIWNRTPYAVQTGNFGDKP